MKSQNNITNLLPPNLNIFFQNVVLWVKHIFWKNLLKTGKLYTLLLCLVDVFFNSRHYNEYQLYSSSRRLAPLLKLGSLQTGVSQEKWKEASPIL